MPKYAYRCNECGEVKTFDFKMGAATEFFGNTCNGKISMMKRVYTPTSTYRMATKTFTGGNYDLYCRN